MTARILVVDDVPANRRLLEARLLGEFYEVALAEDGPEALEQVRSWNPDVVLLDVMMPGMDGYEVCRTLKADPGTAHIPVVMITALTEPAERVRGLEAGADDFLSKPVDDATLFARMRALLRVKQVQDAWRLRAETAWELGIEPPPPPSGDIRGARALVLAGSPEEVREVEAILAAEGLVVSRAAGAEDAMADLARGDLDLAVICFSEAGSDSLRLASRLRAAGGAGRDLPVLLVADPDQRGLVLRGFDLGANDHVLRPVDPNEMRARVRNQIRRRRYEERLRGELDRSIELAVTDPLTGLRNRRYVCHHLAAVLRGGGETSVLLLDVDRFKAINDTHGHAVGDATLRAVADRLKAHVRAADVVARYGGEEFLVVLASTPPEDAAAVAERLRIALGAAPVATGGAVPPLTITASIGVAVAPAGTEAGRAVEAADAALYRAKQRGRNRVEIARAEDFEPPVERHGGQHPA